MSFNQVRKDYLLDRWVVIAIERGHRPTDFLKKERIKSEVTTCPLCPGNEHMTPPAVLVYLKKKSGFKRDKDENGIRHKDWLVRCVPNLYPAFTPPKHSIEKSQIKKAGHLVKAIGHHEVLIESPIHSDDPSNASVSQLTLVITAYIDRLHDLSSKSYVKHVSIFRNHGLEAGASLSHVHSQIIATPFIPRIVKEELNASKNFWKQDNKCIFCELLEKECNGPRFIFQNSGFMVFAPWASIHPLEFWIFPKRHEATMLDMTRNEITLFAKTLSVCFNKLKKLLNDPPYNFGFHLTINKDYNDCYHWHLEVYPKLTIWAGFEKSTGVYINTVSPEVAAESFRKLIN